MLLASGALIGSIYGHADWGILVAALLSLGWHLRHLIIFERALRTRKFDKLRYGEGGIWSQIYARVIRK